jgi:hypothetical protein
MRNPNSSPARNRNGSAGSFWQKAAKSLPPHVRARYASYFVAAERWDQRFDGFMEFISHSLSQSQRLLRRPRSA